MSNGEDKRPPDEGELHLEQVRHPETMYDRTDLSARGIVYFLISLALTLLFIHVLIWGFLRYFSHDQLQPAPRSAAIATPMNETGKLGDPARRFPAPQLQPDPVADMNKFSAAVEEQLDTYGWVDQKAGVVRIPVERAIDILARQGLPVRPAPVPPPRADFGSGSPTVAGAAGGTEPMSNK
jgi:hypothetical protein